MRKLSIAMLLVVSVIFVAAPVMADWFPNKPDEPWYSTNHKMHFPQLPDLTDTGMDVLATWPYPGSVGAEPYGKILADDWQCSETGVVSDIHIWGSWLNDELPVDAAGNEDPYNVAFKLSIHKDIPVGANNEFSYSHPGEELWSTMINPHDPRMQALPIQLPDNVVETFFDPNMNEPMGTDTVVWQYNFFLDDGTGTEPLFRQQRGEIYWLDLQAFPVEGPDGTNQALFGWKTSDQQLYPPEHGAHHFMDDAVFADNTDPAQANGLMWQELVYPNTEPPRSIDLAFVITPEPSTWMLMLMAGFAALTTYVWRRR